MRRRDLVGVAETSEGDQRQQRLELPVEARRDDRSLADAHRRTQGSAWPRGTRSRPWIRRSRRKGGDSQHEVSTRPPAHGRAGTEARLDRSPVAASSRSALKDGSAGGLGVGLVRSLSCSSACSPPGARGHRGARPGRGPSGRTAGPAGSLPIRSASRYTARRCPCRPGSRFGRARSVSCHTRSRTPRPCRSQGPDRPGSRRARRPSRSRRHRSRRSWRVQAWVLLLGQEDLVAAFTEGCCELLVPAPFRRREEGPREVQLHRAQYRRRACLASHRRLSRRRRPPPGAPLSRRR